MFQGFDDTTVDFLWGIRLNNERPWFESHKQDYLDHLYRPMKELGDELYDHVAPQLKGEPLMCKVSRIYRDARRLYGRGPYKDHLWISIQKPAGAWDEAPCFWFELSPDGWSYGMGFYSVKPATMARLRRQLAERPEEMETLMRRLRRQGEFTLSGETYKKPRAQAPSELLAPWYVLKGFSLSHDEALTEELFSRDILAQVAAGYDFLLPFYRYFTDLCAALSRQEGKDK